MSAKKPLALVILDGYGHREDTANNAVANANTPNLDNLFANHPNTLISASGMDVGLPDGQMGNSEVGHTNIGAGRIVYQDLTRITKSIADGEFAETAALVEAMDSAINAGKAVHIMGLMSFAKLGKGRVASLVGRYYAMDRDNNWDRVQVAYDLLTQAKAEFTFDTAVEGLEAAYARDENDEFVKATAIKTADRNTRKHLRWVAF